LGEHAFVAARYDTRISEWPGAIGTYAAPELETATQETEIADRYVQVNLPPATEITLELTMQRLVNPASYQTMPW
jgi:hypothetical protein